MIEQRAQGWVVTAYDRTGREHRWVFAGDRLPDGWHAWTHRQIRRAERHSLVIGRALRRRDRRRARR